MGGVVVLKSFFTYKLIPFCNIYTKTRAFSLLEHHTLILTAYNVGFLLISSKNSQAFQTFRASSSEYGRLPTSLTQLPLCCIITPWSVWHRGRKREMGTAAKLCPFLFTKAKDTLLGMICTFSTRLSFHCISVLLMINRLLFAGLL